MATLTDEEKVTVVAMAPFELAKVFERWAEKCEVGEEGELGLLDPMFADDSPKEFGERIAAGVFRLMKEI